LRSEKDQKFDPARGTIEHRYWGTFSTEQTYLVRTRRPRFKQIVIKALVNAGGGRPPPAIVAIPARNEADRITRCLSALAMQRDHIGAPIVPGSFAVLVLANNCSDGTADLARRLETQVPYPLWVLEVTLTGDRATAGGARRRAMNEAAVRLDPAIGEGAILTTDADSAVSPTWFAENMRALRDGADCVAGYIDAEPTGIVGLGAKFLARGRLEDTYLRQVVEIYALCDPRPHDPWPNHRVSSGASLAVRHSVYRAVRGLPAKALGEDIAFTDLLESQNFKVRHSLRVSVVTSCRLDGRAGGGAADTMRHRRDVPDAICDAKVEPALPTWRRAVSRGLLRKAWDNGTFPIALKRWKCATIDLTSISRADTFSAAWHRLSSSYPTLRHRVPLRPSQLPRQIALAGLILHNLRSTVGRMSALADKFATSIQPDSLPVIIFVNKALV
jgi:hypothetical protein